MTGNKYGIYLKGICLFLLTAGLLCQFPLLVSRLHFQTGSRHLALGQYDQAITEFETATQALPAWLPGFITRQDRFRIYTHTGRAYHEKGRRIWRERGVSQQAFTAYARAMAFLKRADLTAPDTYINTYWLALTADTLEIMSKGHPFTPKETWDAGAWYEKARELRPNGIGIHQTHARYLHRKGDHAAVADLAGKMVSIYPRIYGNLKQEPYYFENLLDILKTGLEDALSKGIQPREALRALSDIHAHRQQMDQAIARYAQSLEIRSYSDPAGDYLHMGRLYLKAGQPADSLPWFQRVLNAAQEPDTAVRQIYNIHKAEKQIDAFIRFAMKLETTRAHPLPDLDIGIAEAFMDLKQYTVAKSRLLRLTAQTPNARAQYLLAKIAEIENDWDQMELAAQKAAVLDRENSGYHLLFSQALNRQKKYAAAEEAATLAIRHAPKEQPWLFDHRAWIRWSQKKYNDAALDWKRAFDLKPDQAVYVFNLARACQQAGRFPEALAHIRTALKLAPDKAEYRQLETILAAIKPDTQN